MAPPRAFLAQGDVELMPSTSLNLSTALLELLDERASQERRSRSAMAELLLERALEPALHASAGGFTVSEPRDLAGKVKPDPRRA